MSNIKKLVKCPYTEPCYMRTLTLSGEWACTALDDTRFSDGMCHFRKATKEGPNEYDKMNGRLRNVNRNNYKAVHTD